LGEEVGVIVVGVEVLGRWMGVVKIHVWIETEGGVA
jgi:hypothetical protein